MHMLRIGRVLLMRVKLYRLRRAKKIAMEMTRNGSSELSFIDKFDYWNAKYLHCGCIKTHIRINRNKPYIIKLFKIYVKTTTPGTFPNFILTAILGFLGGVCLSYAYFLVCVYLDLSTHFVFWISVFSCIFLTVGMTFYSKIRCIVLSILPEACTSRSRAILISLALFALLTGPGSNILLNTKELARTISCTQTSTYFSTSTTTILSIQEQVQDLARNLTKLYEKPQEAIKKGIFVFLKVIKPKIMLLKNILVLLKNTIFKIRKMIKKTRAWLRISIPNLGTPSDFCTNRLLNWVEDCEAMMGVLGAICNPFEIISIICLPLKIITELTHFREFIDHRVFETLKNKIKELSQIIKSIFYVKVSYRRSFEFETNQSKSLKDVYKDMLESREIRVKEIFKMIHWIKYIPALYIIYILIIALIYRYRFFYHAPFDNRHINKFIIELDKKRAIANKQTLFPLTSAEKSNYVSLLSYRLTSQDRITFLQGSIFLILVCLKTSFVFILDYFLFLVLDLVHNEGRLSFHFQRDKTIIGAEGSGFSNSIYNIFNDLFNEFDFELRFDTGLCLPQPIPVDFQTYIKIAVLLGLAWIVSLFQPFALRFRNLVLSNYYPNVARRRAVWLYNHILQTRGVMSQYIRRTIFTRGALGIRSEKPNLFKWLVARFPLLYYIFPSRNIIKECMICGYNRPEVRCATPECTGIYDKECFETLNNICMICNMRQDFKGLDISEEEDSDGEIDASAISQFEPRPNPWWKFWIQVSRTDPTIEMEEGTSATRDQPASSSAPSSSGLQPSKDYFSDQWRRDDWASLEDYDILVQGNHSGTWSRFTTKTPRSPKIQ